MKKGVDFIGVSAGAMIFNDKEQLFLSKRSKNTSNEAGHWETPGGAVEFGETLESAVRREIKEEYGIDIEILEQFPAGDHIIPKERQHWVATTFLAKIKPGQEPKILEPHKCDGIGWFSLDKLPGPLSIITKIDLKRFNKLRPRVGIGVMVMKNGKVLLGKRKGSHGEGEYAWPGGHLKHMESFDGCAKREVMEETGIEIKNIRFLRLYNLKKYTPKHYADIGLLADWKSGKPKVMEPTKSENWSWYDINKLPDPLFDTVPSYLKAFNEGKNFFDN